MKLVPAGPARSPSTSRAFVEIEELSMEYEAQPGTRLLALDQVGCAIAESDFCTIVGPSGCGKSTLLMLTAGLYQPSAGQVVIGGAPVTGPWDGVGMVFQRDLLLEWRTALDNVLLPIEIKKLPRPQYEDRARSLLRLVGLAGFENAFPEQLSVGMRQRVAICRALIHDPRLLLMDEPFAAVDPLTREKLGLDLLRLTREHPTTVLFVTHSVEEAVLLSDEVLVFGPRPGRILRRLDNELPKPRSLASRSDARFHRLVDEIRAEFQAAGVLS
ncbi:MAG TPA: ABC transporter ATP-binding protein [Myxococcales bacterium]|nr:ABC transporter ATP-binding protein [Myxococcales bacterium]